MSGGGDPHWGVIIFLVIVYAMSIMLQLTPGLVTTGTTSAINVTPDAIPQYEGGFFGAVGWIFAIFGYIFVLLGFAISVVTFSNLGLPLIIQFMLCVPCLLALVWTILSFTSAARSSV